MNDLAPTLFDIAALAPAAVREIRRDDRRRKARLAYRATSEIWKRETYRFAVEEFLPHHETFLFEELTGAYEAEAGKGRFPVTVNKKAMAGLQRRLVADGKIELIKDVTRVRSNGQHGLVYRSHLLDAQ